MAIYIAIVESEGAGSARPLWTSRDPELLKLIQRQIVKRLAPPESQKRATVRDGGRNRG